MGTHRKARFCARCGQAFRGHGLWGLCPGCRAETRNGGRMVMRDHEPASGWNLPPGCFEDDVDRAFGPAPRRCRDCGEWAECPCGCGWGMCRVDGDYTEGGDGCDG